MKKFFSKLKSLLPSKRKLIQLYSALLFNANIKGFIKGEIYKGPTKSICTPGLNCYSCPGAVGACPLGSLQSALGASEKRTPFYVIGILLLYGLLLGRFICGFLCPFGLIQELLYKIKSPKLKKSKVTRILSYLKYIILVFLVVIVPIMYGIRDMPLPGFCKYICPAGTLEGAFGLLSNKVNEGRLSFLGPLFTWKFAILVSIIVGSVFVFRIFCRFLCPLGAIYGFFNKFSVFGIKLEKEKCTDCGLCVSKCKLDIRHVNDHECINCGECIEVCPTNAISWKGSKIFLPPNEIGSNTNVNENSSEAEKELSKSKFEERNKKIKKRNNILKIVVACMMVGLLAFALIYYNVDWSSDPPYDTPTSDSTPSSTPDSVPDSTPDSVPDSTPNSTGGGADSTPDSTQDSTPDSTVDSTPVLPPVGNQVGNLCPGYELKVFDETGLLGTTFNPSNNSGKITIINFWGTWCSGCVKELPYFERIATEYKGTVDVVAVHTERDFDTAPEYITITSSEVDSTDGYTGKLYKDSDIIFVRDDRVNPANKWSEDKYFTTLGGTDFYPMTVILDENGVIIESIVGSVTYKDLKEIIDTQLTK